MLWSIATGRLSDDQRERLVARCAPPVERALCAVLRRLAPRLAERSAEDMRPRIHPYVVAPIRRLVRAAPLLLWASAVTLVVVLVATDAALRGRHSLTGVEVTVHRPMDELVRATIQAASADGLDSLEVDWLRQRPPDQLWVPIATDGTFGRDANLEATHVTVETWRAAELTVPLCDVADALRTLVSAGRKRCAAAPHLGIPLQAVAVAAVAGADARQWWECDDVRWNPRLSDSPGFRPPAALSWQNPAEDDDDAAPPQPMMFDYQLPGDGGKRSRCEVRDPSVIRCLQRMFL